MLWNRRFLFLHFPKTAGKSLTRAFIDAWERPAFGIIARGQRADIRDCDHDLLFLSEGSSHESLGPARTVLARAGIELSSFEAIFVAVRNPYDLMVSNYFFMRKSYPVAPDNPKFRFAAERDFKTFCERIPMADAANWLTIDGKMPENLRVLRFESLSDDFELISRRFGFKAATLPQLNASEHDNYATYLTAEVEATIYRKLPWLFDQGFYPRRQFA